MSENLRRLEIVPGCIVCKTCQFHAPKNFLVPEKGFTALVTKDAPSAEELPDVLEAIRKCPEHVIKFRSR